MPSGTFSNLYIDAVFIATNNGSAYTGITNHLDGEDVHSSVSTTTGFKWIVQLTNGNIQSGAHIINMSSTWIRLQVCTNYLNDEGEANSQKDVNYEIKTGTLNIGESLYIGHDNIIDNITPDLSTTSYIPTNNKNSSGHILSAPRIRLFTKLNTDSNWTNIDVAGINKKDSGGEYFTTSLIEFIQTENGTTTSISDAICRRKPSTTAPKTTFNNTDWHHGSNLSFSLFYKYMTASAAGDPHITTLTGDHYEFDYLGAFRLFEDTIQGNKIIINGLSEKGPGRWSEKQYIQKLYIQYDQKYILVDMGFRGNPVKVLENNQMDYTEEELPFNSEAKRYSFNSTYRTQNQDEPITEDLPALIRNQFSLLINSKKTLVNIMHITLQNVNQYNLQPCRFSFNSTKITDKAKGCLVDRKYAPVSKLLTIKDTHEIPEPSKEDLENIPELEIQPKLRNIQWQ